MGKTLEEALYEVTGLKEIEFNIPHIFLPPRYRKICENRNMVLVVDEELVIHVRWEGALHDEYLPLTPKAACHLIKECTVRMTNYRRDLGVFSRFVKNEGEAFSGNSRDDNALLDEELECTEALPILNGRTTVVAKVSTFNHQDMGGESPMPEGEFGW